MTDYSQPAYQAGQPLLGYQYGHAGLSAARELWASAAETYANALDAASADILQTLVPGAATVVFDLAPDEDVERSITGQLVMIADAQGRPLWLGLAALLAYRSGHAQIPAAPVDWQPDPATELAMEDAATAVAVLLGDAAEVSVNGPLRYRSSRDLISFDTERARYYSNPAWVLDI